MLGTMIVHLLLSWDWIIETTGRFFGKLGLQNRINYILNWLLFIDGTLLMVSRYFDLRGGAAFPWNSTATGFAWRRLHDMSANFALILLGLHTALHWSWIVNTFSRYIVQPISRLFPGGTKKDVSV